MDYTNYKCPVCNNRFLEDDDVVVCPECGTPHHRECYKLNNRCFNEDKHSTNENIELLTADSTEKEDLNEEISLNDEKKEAINISQEIFTEIKSNDSLKINGKSVSFYEAAVGKNQKFYIPHFMVIDRTEKNISWNVAAFFVPLAWSLYRKMYKFALIIFALYILMFGSVGYTIFSNEEIVTSFMECVEEDPYFYEDIILYNSNRSDVSLTEKQMKFNKLTNEFKLPLPLQIYIYIVTYGVRIIMGIYATNLYYKKLTRKIENVAKLDISDDMKRSVLFRKCGTLPFIIVAIIGFFEWQMF